MGSRRRDRPGSPDKALREFLAEAEEILERMRGGLADLLDAGCAAGDVDPELVNRLFRDAHSLKGLAGTFGLSALTELAHRLEDLLDGLRMGRLALDAPAVELLDEAVGIGAALLEEAGRGAEDSDATVVAEWVARAQGALGSPGSAAAVPASLALDPTLLGALTEYEEHRLRENLERGRCLHVVEVTLPLAAFEEGLSELTHACREVGEVISTLPAPGAVPESEIRFSLLVASELDAEPFAARLPLDGVSVRCAHGGSPAPGHATGGTGGCAPARPAPQAARPPAELDSLKSISGTVRVDIRKLDELMNLVGELVIQRTAVGEIARQLTQHPGAARVGAELAGLHKTLDATLQDLQARVLDVRMVPLRQVFEKLSRVARRLRRDLGKSVRLEIRGADTELDKLIVEELIDPLMHAVRNAFDHAIESPEQREAAGKSAEGCIRLEAFQRGNHVVIQVADDGRGIDPEAVRVRALERGLVAPDVALTPKQTFDLLFAPGFSTSQAVTETSGRGVGLDVVRANVTALGGIVDLASTPGRGTTLSLTLPITLAIMQALVVRVGAERFAIPLTSVLESLLVEPQSIQRSEGRELLNLRGEPLPVRRLADEFDLPAGPPPELQYVVVIGLGAARLGLAVDALEGQLDAVIKPIQGPVRSVRGIAGATEVGTQGAVLVLDVSALVEDAVGRRDAA